MFECASKVSHIQETFKVGGGVVFGKASRQHSTGRLYPMRLSKLSFQFMGYRTQYP